MMLCNNNMVCVHAIPLYFLLHLMNIEYITLELQLCTHELRAVHN